MAENSAIEWTDHTFNPWIGCQHVSPACDFCYAETLMDTRYGKVKWGPHGERTRTAPANWRKPYQWEKKAATFFAEHGRRQRVFCASLADWLDNKVPQQWRTDLAKVIAYTPSLDWLMLSKRLENFDKLAPWPRLQIPDNVWIGASAENQAMADRRGEQIATIDAKVRFFSCEPLLGPILLRPKIIESLNQVISGGESGSKARPSSPNWHRSLRDQCAKAGVAYLFKQHGEFAPVPEDTFVDRNAPDHYVEMQDGSRVWRIGKKKAGRLLDGIEHNGFPT